MILLQNFVQLFIESAPWLMLGLLVAGIMKAFVPVDLLSRHLGKPGAGSVIKAALLGAPLPLCSCGVIPAAIGLRKSGASKSATTSFLISTPETGVDSIAISYALLGPFMAVIRPIAAITSAITAGLLVGKEEDSSKDNEKTENSAQTSCCSSKPVPKKETSCCASETVSSEEKTAKNESCCASEKPKLEDSCCSKEKSSSPSLIQKVQAGMKFTFIDLVNDITLWLLIGLGFAALITTFVPNDFLTQWGDGFLAFIVMALIGVPMYICATASTPIAAGLLFSGVSPGAVLVFMLVGPATNIATVGLVKRELGSRALAAYLGGVVGVGFIFGYLTNFLADTWNIDFAVQTQHAHEMANTPFAYLVSVLLACLMSYSLIKKLKKKLAS